MGTSLPHISQSFVLSQIYVMNTFAILNLFLLFHLYLGFTVVVLSPESLTSSHSYFL